MALTFDGSTSGLSIANRVIPNAYPFSFFAWVRSTNPAQTAYVVGVGSTNGNESDFLAAISPGNTGTARATMAAGGGNGSVNSTSNVANSTWQPLLVVFNSATSVDVYFASGAKVNGNTGYNPDLTKIVGLSVGMTYGGFGKLAGDIAEVTVWNAALSQVDYDALAAGATPSGVRTANCIAAWPLLTQSATQVDEIGGKVLTGGATTTQAASHPIVHTAPPADTTAPTLTSPTGAQTGATSGSASVTVSEACTAWCLTLAASASAPDAATVKASGTSQAAGAAGVVTFPSRTGLTTDTAYKNYFYAEDAAANPSIVVSSASFTPTATNATPTFSGTIANITGTNGVAITPVNVSGQFSDTDTLTYSASPAGTAWPSGLVVDASTGIISGTVATSTTTGLKVRATDTASQTVDSNAFGVTINAAQQASGTFKTLPLANNTGTLHPNGTAVSWEWHQARIGTAGGITYGSGTVAGDGTLTANGLPTGAGYLMAAVRGAALANDKPYYQAGTVA